MATFSSAEYVAEQRHSVAAVVVHAAHRHAVDGVRLVRVDSFAVMERCHYRRSSAHSAVKAVVECPQVALGSASHHIVPHIAEGEEYHVFRHI